MKIKCNKCEYIGEENEFPKGTDFFQNQFIASCPNCDNRQNPGDATMRMFGGKRPFEFVTDVPKPDDPFSRVMSNHNEAS